MFMYLALFTVFIVYHCDSRATDIAREVEGGVQLLKTGPIQLIVPEILSFTIQNHAGCRGDFVICYVYKPTITREQLREYANVGANCPRDSCTLIMTHTGGVFGLASEHHDGNFYGMLVDSGAMCPRHAVNGQSNFTVRELPNCPVIVDGATLPKDEKSEPKTAKSTTVWIIPVCVGSVLLIIAIAIVVLYFCNRSKKTPVSPANFNRQNQRKSTKPAASQRRKLSASKRSEPSVVGSAAPKTPRTKKPQFHENSPTSNDND